MVTEIIALAVCAMVCILLPLIVLGIVVKKNNELKKGILLSFLFGGILYAVMQWGIKEHALTWLFNNTDFAVFMKNHYIWYLLVVAFAGSILLMIGYSVAVAILLRKQFGFANTLALGAGYAMVEASMLSGGRCVNTIIEIAKGSEMKLEVTTTELFLSGYERTLLFLIDIGLVVVFVFFIKKKMPVLGGIFMVLGQTLVSFLPGFFLAFTLPDFYEVFHRSVALVMVYVVLTAIAFTAFVLMRYCKTAIEVEE